LAWVDDDADCAPDSFENDETRFVPDCGVAERA
jgi:hypothetical protein